MKKLITHLTILFAICTLNVSCDGGDDKRPAIQGEWKMYEQKITTSETDSDLDDMLNRFIQQNLKENETTRTFTELSVKTIIRKKGISGTDGLLSESTDPYSTKGDSLYIENTLQGGITVAKFLITDNTLTTYRNLSTADIKVVAEGLGIDPNTIPSGISGELKIKEAR
ncbi:hypothetical protein D0T84_21075 [Dysgonomonas sp. 521]|uniref:hypothetical protein n=1 Tax=Dysgonomonas sp. 521 TaxID=2302932 RepID=UPI0013D6559D|nr:hypothetical protein [Dysgonomonas sp. 521]NDV97370.1 hypothetical protein [Dysgonomonas sp. 521]